jgi:hypothetical protein
VRMTKLTEAYKSLVRNHEGKIPLENTTGTREDNIKLDLKGMGRNCVDLIHQAQKFPVTGCRVD